MFDGKIVDEESGFEIVGSVENEIETVEQFPGILRSEVGYDAFDGNGRIDGAKLLLSREGFWKRSGGIGFVEKGLALEIRRFDEVTIEDAQSPNAGAGKKRGSGGSDRAATDDNGTRRREPLLAGLADGLEKNLAGVSFERNTVFLKRIQVWMVLFPTVNFHIDDSAKGRQGGNAAVLRFV